MAYGRRRGKRIFRRTWRQPPRARWIGSKATAAALVTPGTGSLTLTTYAPSVTTPRLVTPAAASLALTAFAPTVSTPRLVTPATATLTTTGYAPVVSTPRLVTPATAALVLSAFAPTVTAGAAVSVIPGTAVLTLTTYAPTVTASEPTVTGPVVTLVGVPSISRKRAAISDVRGSGLILVVGDGTLTGEACLTGALLQPSEGYGALVADGLRLLVGAVRSGGEAVLCGESGLRGAAAVSASGTATIAGEYATSGVLAVASEIVARAMRESATGGRMPVRSGGEAAGTTYENDEQHARWLLGLPSEIEA